MTVAGGKIAAVIASLLSGATVSAYAEQMAVVARHTIYPGQVVQPGSIKIVDATYCPNCDAGYLQDAADVAGKIAQNTLIPGKLIFPADLRFAPAVTRGQEVRVFYRKGALQISMLAILLNDAAIGETVSVRNNSNGAVVTGVVGADGTVTVVQ